nr:coiled-coil domain-containing protein 50 isoform X1 [Anolis sagrei ordinatus]
MYFFFPVCRDFAVLEDHTLAHSLQEQEIEHHLATNIQRNRLVQYDLQMAKQLQEEEDRKARARVHERHKDIERQDCEIAQEIQVKLVIEAEQRRRQEEDDEDIARILQQKELQEEKRRKKPLPPEPVSASPYKEAYYPENRDRRCASPRDVAPEQSRSRRPREGNPDPWRGPPLLPEGLDLEVSEGSEGGKSSRSRTRQRERKPEKHPVPPWEAEDEVSLGQSKERRRKKNPDSLERPRAASSLDGDSRDHRERPHRSHERPQRPPSLLMDQEASPDLGRHRRRERQSPGLDVGFPRQHYSRSPNPNHYMVPSHEAGHPPRGRDPRHNDLEVSPHQSRKKNAGQGNEASKDRGRAHSSSSHHGENWDLGTGTKAKGTKEASYSKPRPADPQDQELYDAEIARRLQEEELLANQVDTRAAQVAQDEEIARLLMAEEKKKAYKKAREREKSSTEKKKQDPDWKHETHETTLPPRTREVHEGHHRGKSDKPTRPPPPPTEALDHLVNLTSQQSSKPETSHKGYHFKQ